MTVAAGTFDVTMRPDGSPGPDGIGAMTLDKTYAGDLTGTARGRMLTHMTAVEGSAGYVAIEVVDGTLDGRTGTFALQHSGLMDRGEGALTVTVIPDSGTGELVGMRGELTIDIDDDGTHRYRLTYEWSSSGDGGG